MHREAFPEMNLFRRPLIWRRSSRGSTRETPTSTESLMYLTFWPEKLFCSDFTGWVTVWSWIMPWTQKWDRVTSTLPWGPFYVFVSCAVPSRWWLKVYRLRPHQVFPGDHWIHATASPLFGRASWRHWVWSSNLTWLKWSSHLTWLKLDKTLSPGRWHRRSWMLLMRKRSPASQSFPSSGGVLNAPAYNLAPYLMFNTFSYLAFDI